MVGHGVGLPCDRLSTIWHRCSSGIFGHFIVPENKTEKEYFRSQIDELRKQAGTMQDQFNNIQLAYAKEVEQSQNREKLHRELLEKYNSLKGLYDKLKEDFDKHKKAAKQ